MNLVPDADQLTQIFAHAVAPAFVLGAVVAFISLLMTRLKGIVDQLNSMAKSPAGDPDHAKRDQQVAELKHRAVLLNTAARLALGSGMATTMLLVISFVSAFLHWHHIYGGGFLFVVANGLLTVSLYKFAQEIKAGLHEIKSN